MSFKNLNLDRDRITSCLDGLKPEGIEYTFVEKGNQHHCNFKVDGQQGILAFHFKTNGTTTIQYKIGKNHDLSRDLAAKIVSECMISELKSASCTFKNVTEEQIALFGAYVEEDIEGATILEKIENDETLILRVKGRGSDQVTITFYKTKGTTLLQGRPLPIFAETKLFFCGITSEEEIIENENKLFQIEITKDDVANELAECMPTAYKFLDNKITKIMITSLTLGRIEVDLYDYSSFCFPALRGLEGYIRQLVNKSYPGYKGINKLGSLFKHPVDGAYALQDFAADVIECGATKLALEESYTLWKAKRHPLFHVDKLVATTPIIDNKHDAQQLNNDIFTTIESTFSKTCYNV